MHLGWFAVSRCINHFSCGCDRILDNFREENLGLVYGIISLAITSKKAWWWVEQLASGDGS